jgi:hypothetical protein
LWITQIDDPPLTTGVVHDRVELGRVQHSAMQDYAGRMLQVIQQVFADKTTCPRDENDQEARPLQCLIKTKRQ